jgi:long-chain acyl-CoA synthetase
MICNHSSDFASSHSEDVILGHTLPDLLQAGCQRYPHPKGIHQWSHDGWQSWSNLEFKATVEAIALGLHNLGLAKGDRVAFLMASDVRFCQVDLACLLANLVDVPLDLTQTIENLLFALKQSAARGLVISNLDLLSQILPYLGELPDLRWLIVVEVDETWQKTRSSWLMAHPEISPDPSSETAYLETACLCIPTFLHAAPLPHDSGTFPPCIQLLSLAEIQHQGQLNPSAEQLQALRDSLQPSDLATLIYIPDEQGHPLGVMLSHENLAANALNSFAGLSQLQRGETERVLSFLPLNHVFARSLLYGHLYSGHQIYFSHPNRVMKHLQEVKPTILATVPLLLEKIYGKILEKASKRSQLQRWIFHWSLAQAQQYELGNTQNRLQKWKLKLADWLVLHHWRSLLGGQLKYLFTGGAALNPGMANVLAAAGLPIFQGYGLTQTSSVICYQRETDRNAYTVGKPIAGAEIAIAADQEILVRGVYVMQGYYQNPAQTEAEIDAEGWFHTGDLGRLTADGLLQITGVKKALFKLSTGKYIAPQPIEARLMQSPFIQRAIVVGLEQKYCAALIIPDMRVLHTFALQQGLQVAHADLHQHPDLARVFQLAVNRANCHLPYWASLKRFRLVQADLSLETLREKGWITAQGRINRAALLTAFADEIAMLYQEEAKRPGHDRPEPTSKGKPSDSDIFSAEPSCPTIAQSLNPRFTS